MSNELMTPGEELREYLGKLYPPPNENMNVFINDVDYDFIAEGTLVALVHKSFLNYLLRRLITIADSFLRKYPIDQYGEYRYQNEINDYLKDFTRIKDKHITQLRVRLVKCLETANSNKPTMNEKRKIKNSSVDKKLFCYLCGQEMDYMKDSNEANSATVDHIWPRQMGGLSEEWNYAVACKDCNNKIKKDSIDYSDYHYEKMSFSTSPYSFLREDRKSMIEIAVFAKNGYQCVVCSQPASIIGQLYIGKLEPNDGWHFLNLAPYCKKHRPLEANDA